MKRMIRYYGTTNNKKNRYENESTIYTAKSHNIGPTMLPGNFTSNIIKRLNYSFENFLMYLNQKSLLFGILHFAKKCRDIICKKVF